MNRVLAGITFAVTAGRPVLSALPDLPRGAFDSIPDVHVVFTGVSRKDIQNDPKEDHSELLGAFLQPPYIGACVQTLPLMLDPDRSISVAGLLRRGRVSFSVPMLSVPGILARIRECSPHASEVLLILHALTVEIRDFREHRIDVFYLDELEYLLYSEFAPEAYRRLFSMFLPDFGGVLVHSSAVARKKGAALFLAPDEGGKSTAAGLSPNGGILCDDRNVLKRVDSGFQVYSTPWGKVYEPSANAPLAGIFLLEKAAEFRLKPLDPRFAVHFLWEDNRPFWDLLPKNRRTAVFNLLADACGSVPVFSLGFPEDHIDWHAIDAALTG